MVTRFASLVTRKRIAGLIAILAILVSGVIIGVIGQPESKVASDLPHGSDSRAALEMAKQLPKADGSAAIVLFTRNDGGKLDRAQIGAIAQQIHKLGGSAEVPVIPAEDGTAVMTLLEIDAASSSANGAAVKDLRARARTGLPDGVQAQVTGPAAMQADLAAVFDGADLRLLFATAAIVALLLLITYRSPILWIIPLLVVGLADQVAAVAATHALKAMDLTWREGIVGILSVLVFGAGTDYALLLISRYRDELRRHDDRREAMTLALSRTFEAVLASATTVFLGLLTLTLSLFDSTRALGVACAVGVLVAAAFVLVVLPAVLVCFGRWVFWPRVPRVGDASQSETRSVWRRVGEAVAARPAAFVAGTLVLIVVAALPMSRLSMGLSDADQFLKKPEAIVAAERLSTSFPAGSSSPVRIVVRGDATGVIALAKQTPGVASVQPVATAGGVTEVQAVLTAAPDSAQAETTVTQLRTRLAGTGAHVAGATAEAIDADAATARDRKVIFPLILALVLVALVVLLRSLVAPLVLVVTVVGTYVAALGLAWVLFRTVFGFSGLDVQAPLYAFVFLVALGVDYNIFLITRAAEESREHGSREGMLRALAATGGVITSAGILLAAVFAVLGVLPLVVLAQIGVIICIGVLLDTLVVRTVMVPSIALLLGDRFWWPRRIAGPSSSECAERPGHVTYQAGPSTL